MKIVPGKIPHQTMFSYLLASVAPRPIAFASTVDLQGNTNLSPFSFFNVFGSNPPVLVFSPSRRGRDNTLKNTFLNLKEVPEVVISCVTYSMVQQANLASNEFPRGVSEFGKAGFHQIPSEFVRPPRIKESPVNFECRVLQIIETGDGPGAGNLVVCEVLLMHIDDGILNEEGKIDPDKIDLVARMGGDYYCRASGPAVFTVEKPGNQPGMGIDYLPEHIRNSLILTGNDLGVLGSQLMMPDEEEIHQVLFNPYVREMLDTLPFEDPDRETLMHEYARNLIGQGRVREALCLLMIK